MQRARNFLKTQPNFFLEMKWDVNIKVPLVSYFSPNDVCNIWKFGENVRMNYSFAEFKNLRCVRIPSSWYFIGGFSLEKENFISEKDFKNSEDKGSRNKNKENKEKILLGSINKNNKNNTKKNQKGQKEANKKNNNILETNENNKIFKISSAEESRIIQANWEKNIFFNPHEDFEEEEKNLILKDIMANRRIHGEFKLKKCEISESLGGWYKKPVVEKINGWNAKKYEVSITAFFNLHNKEKFYYEDFVKEEYFDEKKALKKVVVYSEDGENTKKNLADGFKVKNDKMRNALMKMGNKKEKKLKAYVWIADNFPIKSSVNLNKN